MTGPIKIAAINTYPVKGMSVQAHQAISIETSQNLPHDRAWAIETGGKRFNATNPQWLPKIAYAQRMSSEKLAALSSSLDLSDGRPMLSIVRDGKQVARGDLSSTAGRSIVEQFFAAYMKDELRGSPKVVHSDGHHFTDVPEKRVSILNLATVADIERVAGRPIDPLRFRANIHIEGAPAWEEFNWIGKDICVDGRPAFKVMERIQRCAAINVNPETAERDINLPRTLVSAFTHDDCGIYAKVITDMTISQGQKITVS